LYLASNPDAVVARLAADLARGFTVRNFYRNGGEGDWGIDVLVDNRDNPQVMIVHQGLNFMVHGAIEAINPAMEDVFHCRVEHADGWPTPLMKEEWARDSNLTRHGIFLNTAPYQAWRGAVMAGFEADQATDKHLLGTVAYQWDWHGEPRYGHLVEHPCRLVEGQELFELMRRGVHYDPEGSYIRMCLEANPSFVCEVDGQPVCWSCMHLNGSMGMIYTPEEHRRKGYARSLAAFQLDYVLGREGFACCHVIDFNTASMQLCARLGATCREEPLVWRMVYWPDGLPEGA
jgi:GNAT superfamily N-acetyltransferase